MVEQINQHEINKIQKELHLFGFLLIHTRRKNFDWNSNQNNPKYSHIENNFYIKYLRYFKTVIEKKLLISIQKNKCLIIFLPKSVYGRSEGFLKSIITKTISVVNSSGEMVKKSILFSILAKSRIQFVFASGKKLFVYIFVPPTQFAHTIY